MNEDRVILYENIDGVATITFNRPGTLNAWTPEMEGLLREAIDQAAQDAAVRVVVLTGAGRGFSAGADLSRERSPLVTPPAGAAGASGQRYRYLMDVPKPLIAAINGPAAGLGLCLALYCDLRFVAEGAKLTTAFAPRGLIAEHGAAWLLSRLIGPMSAADLLMSGRTFLADEALIAPGPCPLQAGLLAKDPLRRRYEHALRLKHIFSPCRSACRADMLADHTLRRALGAFRSPVLEPVGCAPVSGTTLSPIMLRGGKRGGAAENTFISRA